jgi:hypothetical protein
MAGASVLGLVVIEVGLRLYLHRGYDRPTDVVTRSESPLLRFELQPDTRITTNFLNPEQLGWPYTISVNAHGYRGRAFDPTSQAPTVIVLGDSIAMGMGVDDDETFASVLESRLRGGAQVLNWGVLGYNTIEAVEIFKRRVDGYDPEVVVLAFHPNDRMPLMIDYATVLPWTKRSITVATVFEVLRMRALEDWGATPELADAACGALDELVELTAALGAKLLVFQVYCAWDADSRGFTRQFLDRADRLGATSIHLDPRFCDSERYWIPKDEHPNPLGHEYLAEELRHHIQPMFAALTR